MENASKALLMAGGVLIALLIIGSLVLLFTQLQDYQNTGDDYAKQSQIVKFNNQFDPYDRDNLTLMDLQSIYNKIVSNNNKNEEYQIIHNINDDLVNLKSENGDISDYFFSRNGKRFSDISEREKINRLFKCIEMDYDNESGRINKMNFEDSTPPVSSWIDINR